MNDKIEAFGITARLTDDGKDVILLCESGSGTYGTRHAGSDLDIRGVYVEPLNNILSIRKNYCHSPESLQISKECIVGHNDDKSIDWQLFEIKKFLSLLVYKSNMNLLEWLYTPLKYINKYDKELKRIADKSLSKQIGHHARGWAYSIYKMDWDIPKKCMYAIRPIMLYIVLCRDKEFIPDINVLAERLDLTDHVEALKRANEKGVSTPRIAKERNNNLYNELVDMSKEIEVDCWLPDKAESYDLANEFLLKVRKNVYSKG